MSLVLFCDLQVPDTLEIQLINSLGRITGNEVNLVPKQADNHHPKSQTMRIREKWEPRWQQLAHAHVAGP